MTPASQEVKAGARKAYKPNGLERSARYAEDEQKAQVEMEEWNTKFYAMGVFSLFIVVLSHPTVQKAIETYW